MLLHDDPSSATLVLRARMGDKDAWNRIVERFAPVLWSVCRRYGLSPADTADVSQRVWMVLIEQLPALREPAALPGWLVTTARRECFRMLRGARQYATLDGSADADTFELAADDEATAVDRNLLAAEREAALREAFGQLRPHCQELLAMLVQDPPVPYAEITAKLNMKIGSIGPTRARCLDELRRCPALAALIAAETGAATMDNRRR